MTKLILLPGSLICDTVGLTEDSDNRQILRMFLNTLTSMYSIRASVGNDETATTRRLR